MKSALLLSNRSYHVKCLDGTQGGRLANSPLTLQAPAMLNVSSGRSDRLHAVEELEMMRVSGSIDHDIGTFLGW